MLAHLKRIHGTRLLQFWTSLCWLLKIQETMTLSTDADRSANTKNKPLFVPFKCPWSAIEVPLKCLWSAVEVPLMCRWSAFEGPLKCRWSAVEVLLKGRWSAIEVPLKCQQPKANSHSHWPSPANSPIKLSTVGWSKTARFNNLVEKNGPPFLVFDKGHPPVQTWDMEKKTVSVLAHYFLLL